MSTKGKDNMKAREFSNNYWKGYSDGQAESNKNINDDDYKEGFKRGKYDKSHGFDCRYD